MKTLCCVAGSTKEHTVQTFLTSATNSNSCRTPIPTQGKWIIIMALWQILMISRMCTITMEWINDLEFNIDIKIAVTCKSPFLFVTVFVWVDDPYYLQFILSYKSFIFDTLICLIHVIVYMFFLQFEWVFYINGFFWFILYICIVKCSSCILYVVPYLSSHVVAYFHHPIIF